MTLMVVKETSQLKFSKGYWEGFGGNDEQGKTGTPLHIHPQCKHFLPLLRRYSSSTILC